MGQNTSENASRLCASASNDAFFTLNGTTTTAGPTNRSTNVENLRHDHCQRNRSVPAYRDQRRGHLRSHCAGMASIRVELVITPLGRKNVTTALDNARPRSDIALSLAMKAGSRWTPTRRDWTFRACRRNDLVNAGTLLDLSQIRIRQRAAPIRRRSSSVTFVSVSARLPPIRTDASLRRRFLSAGRGVHVSRRAGKPEQLASLRCSPRGFNKGRLLSAVTEFRPAGIRADRSRLAAPSRTSATGNNPAQPRSTLRAGPNPPPHI